MGVQSAAFLAGEGDAYHQRNKDKAHLPDPVFDAITYCGIAPKYVVEIGCGDGWRLELLRKNFDCLCLGIDPSSEASLAAWRRLPPINVHVGYGHNLPSNITIGAYPDLIIFGFCLYLFDREDLFAVATEADAVLADGGHIIIHDFFPDYPYKRRYEHKEGLWSYKMDYTKLWTAHPAYNLEHCTLMNVGDERAGVAVIKKDTTKAFPPCEF